MNDDRSEKIADGNALQYAEDAEVLKRFANKIASLIIFYKKVKHMKCSTAYLLQAVCLYS